MVLGAALVRDDEGNNVDDLKVTALMLSYDGAWTCA